MAGRVAIGHTAYLVDIAHVTVVICHNCQLFRIPVFVSKIAVSVWIVYVCTSTPHLSSHPWSLLKCRPVSVSWSWFLRPWAFRFYVVSQSHNSKFFLWVKSSNRSGEEKKLSMCSLWPTPSTILVIFVTGMGCWRVLCHPLSLPRYISMSYVESLESRSTFWWQNICMFWGCTVWKLPIPWISQLFRPMPNVRKGCKVLKSLFLEFQISLVLSIVCRGCHPSWQLHSCYCLWSAETEVCDNNLSIPLFVHRIDRIAAPVLSSSPPVCLELYVPSVMSVPQMQTFPLQSHQVGEKVPRQTSASIPRSNDLTPQPAK